MLKNTYDILVLADCENGNPNGDPSGGNAPRILQDGRGKITAECLKSKIRKAANHDGYDTYMKYGEGFDEKKYPENSDVSRETILGKYIDARWFGAVVAKKGKNYGIRGSVQICDGVSFHPVMYSEVQIVSAMKSEITVKFDEGQKNTFGSKYTIDYGLFYFKIRVHSQRSEETQMSEKEFDCLIEAIKKCFLLDQSSARLMTLRKLLVFKHEEGDCFNQVNDVIEPYTESVKLKDGIITPTKYSDYVLDFENVKPIDGIQVTILK